MSETLPTSDPGTQKRRSTRIVQAVPITVSGVDALGQPFKERTTTVMVNCHGCKYQSKHYVPKNSIVTLEIPRMEPAFPPRIVPGHVVWVQRPRTVRELFQIGLEFEAPGNVWGIAFPPEDWFPCADERVAAAAPSEELDIDVLVESESAPESSGAPVPLAASPEKSGEAAGTVTPSPTAPSAAGGTPPIMVTGDAKIHVMPSPAAAQASTPDAQIAVARQMAKIVAEAKETLDKTLRRGAQTAINEEMTIVRQQLDAQMHETVEHAIRSSIERVSEAEVKKVIHQAANKTAAIVEEARLTNEANIAQIDAKVRDAVRQAVSQATEQAISQVANQAAAIAEQARKTSEANIQLAEERTRQAAEEAAGMAAQRAAAIAEEARRTTEASVQQAQQRTRQAAEDAASLAAQRASAIAEEARQATEAHIQLAEERARKAAEEAARRAVQQAVAQDLKLSVEVVVERVIAEREAKSSSQQVLASPELTPAHIEEWKKTFEQTASEVRSQLAEQSRAEADAATRKWREQFDAMLSGASATLDEKLNEVSQAAMAMGDQHVADRKQSLRTLLNEVISGAETSILSLGAGLSQERASAEQAKLQLEEAAKATIEQARRQIDEMVATRQETIGQRTNAVTTEAQESIESLCADLARERASAEQAKAQLEEAASAAFERARLRIEEMAATERETIEQQTNAVMASAQESIHSLSAGLAQERAKAEQAKTQLEEAASAAFERARLQMAEMAATGQETIEQQTNAVVASAQESIHSLSAGLAQERVKAEQAQAQLEQAAKAALEQTQQRIDDLITTQRAAIERRTDEIIAERVGHIDPVLQASAQKVIENFSSELDLKIAPKREEAERAFSAITNAGLRAAEVQASLNQQTQQAGEQAAHIQDSLQSWIRQVSAAAMETATAELAKAQQAAAQIQNELGDQRRQASEEIRRAKGEAIENLEQASNSAIEAALSKLGDAVQQADRVPENIRGLIEQASGQVALIQHAARERVQRESETTVQKAVAELAFAGEEVVRLQNAIREQTQRASELAEESSRVTQERVQLAAGEVVRLAVSELQNASVEATQLQNSVREQLRQVSEQAAEIQNRTHEQVRVASEQAVQESLERMKLEAAKYPAEFEMACRATITRVEEELDQKSSEMQHSAYEALLKSSEWYQKKAQTNMQSTMERVIENSSNALQDKAAEVSSLVASELDHYRRGYVEHGRAEIEEAAKEVLDRERLHLNETAGIAHASFTNHVQQLTHNSLKSFQEVSHEAIEKAREQAHFGREEAIEEFQKKLDEKVAQGVEQAATYLQSQLVPLLDSWAARQEAEKQEWMQHVKKASEESIEAFKARLDNATNGWLLASAATLGQNSQAVLDSLSKTAEKRMRETCSQVLAGMGDMLKERLIGISTALGTEHEDKSRNQV